MAITPTGPSGRERPGTAPAVQPWNYVLTEPNQGEGELTPEAYALLEAIAKSESAGSWNVIYGGSKFSDFSDHPRKYVEIKSGPNKGKLSSAAGKFQILASTYDRVAPKLGITDFSPTSQQKIAWHLAKEAYGPELQRDLERGDVTKVASRLAPIWTSLPGGIEAGTTGTRFKTAYTSALGHPVPPANIPEVASAVDAIESAAPIPANVSPALALARGSRTPITDAANIRPLDLPPLESAKKKLETARLSRETGATGSPIVSSPGLQMRVADMSSDRLPSSYTMGTGEKVDFGGTNTPKATMAKGVGSLLEDGTSPAAPTPKTQAGLSAPGAGLTAEQKAAMTAVQPQKSSPSAPVAGLTLPQRPAMTAMPQTSGNIKTSGGIAGTVQLPRDVRPASVGSPRTDPGLMPKYSELTGFRSNAQAPVPATMPARIASAPALQPKTYALAAPTLQAPRPATMSPTLAKARQMYGANVGVSMTGNVFVSDPKTLSGYRILGNVNAPTPATASPALAARRTAPAPAALSPSSPSPQANWRDPNAASKGSWPF